MKTQLAIISILTVAAQLAAFIKLRFTARIFGVGPELDGYNLALVLPTMISAVLTGLLQTGLFPVRARIKARADMESVNAFERSVLLIVVLLGSSITLVLIATSGAIAPLVAKSGVAPVKASVAFAFPLVASLVALNMLGDCTGFLLAMRNRFAIAAGAPILNGIFGAVLLWAWPAGGLFNLVIGTVLGVALQVTVSLCGLRLTGFRLIGPLPTCAQFRQLWKELISLGAWILPGVIFSNLVVSLPPLWVVRFGAGAVSAFGYGYRLYSSGLQLVIMASSTVVLAHLSDLVAQNNESAVRATLRKAAWSSLVVGLFGVLTVWGIGSPALQWVFGGRFDALAAGRVADHWLWLTVGLPFSIMGNVYSKLWQAQGKSLLMTIVAAGTLLALIGFFALLLPFAGEFAVSGALTGSAIATLIAGFFVTKRTLRAFRTKPLFAHHYKVLEHD